MLLRWSQTVIDLAGGDPAKGASFVMGSRLAAALRFAASRDIGRASRVARGPQDAAAMAQQQPGKPTRCSITSTSSTIC